MTQDINGLIARLEKREVARFAHSPGDPVRPPFYVPDPDCQLAAAALREQRDEIGRLHNAWTALNEVQAKEWRRANRAEAERDAAVDLERNTLAIAEKFGRERDAAMRDAERYETLIELWHASTELTLTQDADGGWSITVVEPVEGLPAPGRWTGETPDAAIDAATKAKP